MAWDQKLKLFYLRDYLLENTDEKHTVRTSAIKNYLQSTYGISATRKTIYNDLEMLKAYGIDIEYDNETQGYKVIQRDFELYEVQLLIDSIQSNKYITQKIAKEISDKLKKLASANGRETLKRQSYVTDRIRNMGNSAFKNTDNIHTCILNEKKLSFRYFTYTVKKQKLYRKKTYIVSPHALIWNDNQYYLLAYYGKDFRHFRVDRMDDIKPLDDDIEGKDAFKKINLSDYLIKVFSMYRGKEERVGLRFHNNLAGVVLDRFGKDVMIIPDGADHFTINVAIEVSPQFFGWICGLKRGVKIISPDTVVKQMGEYVSRIAEMYQTDEKTQESDTDT